MSKRCNPAVFASVFLGLMIASPLSFGKGQGGKSRPPERPRESSLPKVPHGSRASALDADARELVDLARNNGYAKASERETYEAPDGRKGVLALLGAARRGELSSDEVVAASLLIQVAKKLPHGVSPPSVPPDSLFVFAVDRVKKAEAHNAIVQAEQSSMDDDRRREIREELNAEAQRKAAIYDALKARFF